MVLDFQIRLASYESMPHAICCVDPARPFSQMNEKDMGTIYFLYTPLHMYLDRDANVVHFFKNQWEDIHL